MLQLNFSYVITEPADGAWGVRTAGGDWSGMIGQLVDREVMLGAAAFAISQASRAANEGSRMFYNHGEGPYYDYALIGAFSVIVKLRIIFGNLRFKL